MAPDAPGKSGLSRIFDSLLRWVGSVQTNKSVHVEIRKNVKVVRIVKGRTEMLDSQGLLGEEVLSEIASQIGMSVPELQQLIASGQVINTSQLSEAQLQALKQTGQTPSSQTVIRPAVMTECPKCKRKTPEIHHTCIYCGELLAPPLGAKPAVNEVDKKFLASDVQAESEAKNQETQPLHDTFQDRLKDL